MNVRHLCVLALIALALFPAPARAENAYSAVSTAINQSSTSIVPLCEFSNAELAQAESEAPPLADEYQSFNATVQTAIEAQAQGACQHKKTTAGPAMSPASITGGGKLPPSIASHTAAGLPLVVALILILAALAMIGCGVAFAFAYFGADPQAGRAAGHSLREAEYHLGARWDDFTDRFRR